MSNEILDNKKNNKREKILLGFGIVTFLVSAISLAIFIPYFIRVIDESSKDLAEGIGLVVTLIFYFFPGFIMSLISSLLNI